MSMRNFFTAAAIVAAVAIPSTSMAVDAAGCASARASCYDTWYIPNWGCDNLYADCMEKAKRETYTPEP